MSECIFCQIIQGSSPASVVHEDDTVVAFMDIAPVNPGHTLIAPRQHATYLADMPQRTGARLMVVAQQIAAAIQASDLRADGTNMFLADGAAAGQEVFHVHLHVIPRFTGDGMRLHIDYGPAPQRDQLDQQAKAITGAMKG